MESLKEYFCDLHVHIGRASDGGAVKVTASSSLTFANIVKECLDRKGIEIVGIVDCASPRVLRDIRDLMKRGDLCELPDGGLHHKEKVTVLLGAEIETWEGADSQQPGRTKAERNAGPEEGGRKASQAGETEQKDAETPRLNVARAGHGMAGVSHHLIFFPFLKQMEEFSRVMGGYIANLDLSTQRARITGRELFNIARAIGAAFLPAHAFTPHKSFYGNCAPRLSHRFSGEQVEEMAGLELGLSSDTDLADHIHELKDFTFLSNSDAHSLPKIGREYNLLLLARPTFKEVMLALRREAGRKFLANYGIDPKLGRYHRTYCLSCEKVSQDPPPSLSCSEDPEHEVVVGVLDRIVQIQDYPDSHSPPHRPPYRYQVPLEFVLKGNRLKMDRLLAAFGTEMAVLHRASRDDLRRVVGWEAAGKIIAAREGSLSLEAGGGGHYGKVASADPENLQLTFLGSAGGQCSSPHP